MNIERIEGCTHVIGESQGYLPLPIRIVEINCSVNGRTRAIETAWRPTEDELKKLAAGEPIILRLLCQQHPPVMLGVGKID